MDSNPPQCLRCNRTSSQVPLVRMLYRDAEVWICPQHLPLLIHNPSKLADKLPGIEILGPSEEDVH